MGINKKLIKNSNKGTTLVEALVAILILSIGIIPCLEIILLANGFSSSIKNNLIAANLSQEGVEVVRAIRDNNWFSNLAFNNGLADGTYRVDWNSNSPLPENGNPPLKLSSIGLYNYSSGADTNFRRRLTIVNATNELIINAEVTWTERGKSQLISVESHLFDWK